MLTKRRAWLGSFLLLCLAALCMRPALAQLADENLLVTKPDGYIVGFETKKNNMTMQEWVPSSQAVDNWMEMLTVQIFHGLKAAPQQFQDNMVQRWKAACPNASAATIASPTENGYPAQLWLLQCPNNPETNKPENTWSKAILGNDSFYLVQKAFKFDPSKEQITQLMNFLRSVGVCDTRLPDRACPKSMTK
jgi:hypothetical protein